MNNETKGVVGRILVTSDHHFGHRNIIKYCNRPFESVNEMDHVMIEVWNQCVSDDDMVVHLGDFTFGNAETHGHIMGALKGKKLLTKGNHDNRSIVNHTSWLGVRNRLKFKYLDRIVHMRHYPYTKEEMTDESAVYLHGHSHGSQGTFHDRQIDVGVDCWSFCPIELGELIDLYDENFNKG